MKRLILSVIIIALGTAVAWSYTLIYGSKTYSYGGHTYFICSTEKVGNIQYEKYVTQATVDDMHEYKMVVARYVGRKSSVNGEFSFPADTINPFYPLPVMCVSGLDNCPGLTKVQLPSSVTYIDSRAFWNDSNLTEVNLDSVTKIGNQAFGKCKRLTKFTGASCLTYLGDSAFYNCSGMTTVALPKSLEYMGSHVFHGCTGMTELDISSKFLGASAFWGCTGLTKLDLPSMSSIAKFAFYGCKGLTKVTIPCSVSSIGSSAFCGCTGVTELEFSSSSDPSSLVSPPKCTSIGSCAFWGCAGLTSVKLPVYLRELGGYAFYSCERLSSVSFNRNLTSIGTYAFSGTSLKEVHLPASLTTLEMAAFGYCDSLSVITVDAGNTTLDSRDDRNAVFESSSNTLLATCKTSTIPDDITAIGDGAFSGRKDLGSITLPASVTTIGDFAFQLCDSLKTVVLPASLTEIGVGAFRLCESLKTVTLPATVRKIDRYAFLHCQNMDTLTFLTQKCTIVQHAFSECTGLKHIFNYSTEPQDFDLSYRYGEPTHAFDKSLWSKCVLHVPAESVDLYRDATEWKNFIIEGMDTGGIGDVVSGAAAATPVGYYDLAGRRLSGAQPGVNIVRYSDGTSRKVVVR